jgi:hypothetical protein
LAISHRVEFPEFKIIPIRIDECGIPSFLKTTKWIELVDGKLSESIAFDILYSFYYSGSFRDINTDTDIYIARSWRESEKAVADKSLSLLINNNYRLIGDSKDQKGFDKGGRVKSLIESCGGLVAILPHRDSGNTSKYIIDEINIAKSMDMPVLCIADKNINMKTYNITPSLSVTPERDFSKTLEIELENFNERLKEPYKPHFVFFAKNIEKENSKRHTYVEVLIELVTGMKSVYGDQIYTGEIQKFITSTIQNSLVVLADISNDNLNTCIEVGIARGANCNYHLISRKPRRRPPFMFRDQQVWFYEDEVELLGIIHKILLPYKRRIINYEYHDQTLWA